MILQMIYAPGGRVEWKAEPVESYVESIEVRKTHGEEIVITVAFVGGGKRLYYPNLIKSFILSVEPDPQTAAPA